MEILYRITVLTMFSIFASFSAANAQLYKIEMEEKMENSTLIIEGEVLEQCSYLGPDNIAYTANKVKVYKAFKDLAAPETVTIITMGGNINGEIHTWSHLLGLMPREFGIFFLKETNRPFDGHEGFSSDIFEVYSSSQGFLKYGFEDGRLIASAPFCRYQDAKNELETLLTSSFGNPIKYSASFWDVQESDEESCIVYRIEVSQPNPTQFPYELEAVVSVKSTLGSQYLSQAAIVAEYDASAIGDSVVLNGILEIDSTGISAESNYVVEAKDIAPNKLEVKVKAVSTGTLVNLVQVTENFSELLRLKVTFTDIVDPSITLDVSQMAVLSELYNPVSERPERYPCIKTEGDFNSSSLCDPPVITSFDPACVRAGTDDILTIRGTCFGDSSAFITFHLQFTNSKAGPDPIDWVRPHAREIIAWSDTLIKVMVPSRAVSGMDFGIPNSVGSGFFKIDKGFGAGGIGISPDPLCVTYSVSNDIRLIPGTTTVLSFPVFLGNYNGMGGQSIAYGDDFKSYPGATAAFERALVSWRCATGINYIVQDANDIDLAVAGLVDFFSLPAGVAGATANTFPDFIPCDSLGYPVGANRKNFTIVFNNTVKWHTDTLMPTLNAVLPVDTLDLESTALHELGHSHLLNHSNDSTDLMFYRKQDGVEYRRIITTNSLAGGLYIMDITENETPDSCQAAMQTITGDCTKLTDVIEVSPLIKAEITLFPNPTNGILNISLDYFGNSQIPRIDWTLQDMHGRRISSDVLQQTTTVDMSSLPLGIYFFSVYGENGFIKSYKVIKQ